MKAVYRLTLNYVTAVKPIRRAPALAVQFWTDKLIF
jgi:hypothetical protein